MRTHVWLKGQLWFMDEQDLAWRLRARALLLIRNQQQRQDSKILAAELRAVILETDEKGRRLVDLFPTVDGLCTELVVLLTDYCAKQHLLSSAVWEAGWETEIVPGINALIPPESAACFV